MSVSSRAAWIAQIEAAIEAGGFAQARQLIASAETHLGPDPALAELGRRVAEVESISAPVDVASAIRRAREEVSRANYPGALGVLQVALKQAPQDPELRDMVDQTTKAALRHEAAAERNRAVAASAEHVEGLLAQGDLEAAAAELHEAGVKFGRHSTLATLSDRLEALRREAGLEQTIAFVDQGRAHLDSKNWQGALLEAERILRLDPRNAQALELKQKAQAEIEREAAGQEHRLAIEKAGQDVERLIAAGEMARATRALEEAVDTLGRDPSFEELAGRLDQAKVDLQAKKRLEWTQRRLNEAESLVRQAGRLSLQGKYELAIERLAAARELNPEHPELAGMLQAAESARERGEAERRRNQELGTAKASIRSFLDGLNLNEAEAQLQTTRRRFPDDPQLAALGARLKRLRESERSTALPVAVAAADPEAEDQALAHQRALAAAYSWKQAFLYPFRGDALTAFAILLGAGLLLEIFDALPVLGAFFAVLRSLLPILVLGFALTIVRETFAGHNVLLAPAELVDAAGYARDLGLVAVTALVASLPLLLFVLTHRLHGLLTPDGAVGWWIVAPLGYLAALFAVPTCAAAAAFGTRQLPRLVHHLRSFSVAEGEPLLAVGVGFAVVVAVTMVRASFVPLIPWMGAPLATALEVWALVCLPHLAGVVLRRHRIELGRVYG